MKFVLVRILFNSGVREIYYMKKENMCFEDVKELKNNVSNMIKESVNGTIELINFGNGFETIIKVTDISTIDFGKIEDNI